MQTPDYRSYTNRWKVAVFCGMKTLCGTALLRNTITCAVLGLATIPLTGLASAGQVASGQQKHAPVADSTVYRVGGDVTAPRPISTPLPTPPAKTNKQRKVVVSFVVTTDGGVRDIKVVKHFKPDFDRAAVNTVATWKFQPATKAGKAVAVLLETEIKFTPQ